MSFLYEFKTHCVNVSGVFLEFLVIFGQADYTGEGLKLCLFIVLVYFVKN